MAFLLTLAVPAWPSAAWLWSDRSAVRVASPPGCCDWLARVRVVVAGARCEVPSVELRAAAPGMGRKRPRGRVRRARKRAKADSAHDVYVVGCVLEELTREVEALDELLPPVDGDFELNLAGRCAGQ